MKRSCSISLSACAATHPNRLAFTGILCLLDKPSRKPLSGSCGHLVILSQQAAVSALPSLLGMGISATAELVGHDRTKKIGVITAAQIRGKRVIVKGFVYKRDFPEVVQHLRNHRIGMSFECEDAHIEDMRAENYRVTRLTFVDAAVMLEERAGFGGTRFTILDR